MNPETLEKKLTTALKLLALPAITRAALFFADAVNDQQGKPVLSISVISIPVLASLAVLAGNSLGNDNFFNELSRSAIESIGSVIKSIRSGKGSIGSDIKLAIRPGRKTTTIMIAVASLLQLMVNNLEETNLPHTSQCLLLTNAGAEQLTCQLPGDHLIEKMLETAFGMKLK